MQGGRLLRMQAWNGRTIHWRLVGKWPTNSFLQELTYPGDVASYPLCDPQTLELRRIALWSVNQPSPRASRPGCLAVILRAQSFSIGRGLGARRMAQLCFNLLFHAAAGERRSPLLARFRAATRWESLTWPKNREWVGFLGRPRPTV